MSRTKVLWVREPALQAILSGRKRVEVRVGYPNIRRLQRGDVLLLNERYPYRIRDIRVYPSHEALLAHEDPHTIAPHLRPEEVLPALRALYPPEKEALGVYALEIEPIEPSTNSQTDEATQ
ncbi:MAG: ASCH domain-containing protein [Ardenticatenia bacterium]|uniref:ASCH domain-containing protein n=1 Tax=Ardenticatena maritima TaxID=872965 RepID=A0A0M9UD22_9CHLR|nr:ASCH domain-containing protein [Ardenticatena maritima]KPL86556.1 hypothetical protein SE16_14935 [Ardenticatena maritima]RME09371.1 MAG: ASCH domain-containing protein [Ardenticatenia bacterium]GAP63554.1 hypothetical protein ARMA_1977 [Ardenticatena maritima]